jgi:hypothetical protein
MKNFVKLFYLLSVIVVLFSFTLITASCTDTPEESEYLYWPEMPENNNPNLKYFGYYHIGNCIEEVAAMGNVNFSKVDARDIDEIAELYNNGYYIFIMTRYIFFSSGQLPDDYETRWSNAKQQLQPYMDKIIGFYIDEPYVTGKTKEAFHVACQTVRADYPDKKMMSVMSIQGMVGADEDYFNYCTDLAYDYYDPWNITSVQDKLNTMKAKFIHNNQNIWLIPKAFYTVTPNGSDAYFALENKDLPIGEDVLRWIKGCYELAVSDPQIVGIYAFVYDNDGFDIPLRGFMNPDSENFNDTVRGTYIQIGKAIIEN